MGTFSQLPGTLNFQVRSGDELGASVRVAQATTGYTAASTVYSLVTGNTVSAMSTTLTFSGTVATAAIAMTEVQTAALPVGTYGWRMVTTFPGNVQNTQLDGKIEVIA